MIERVHLAKKKLAYVPEFFLGNIKKIQNENSEELKMNRLIKKLDEANESDSIEPGAARDFEAVSLVISSSEFDQVANPIIEMQIERPKRWDEIPLCHLKAIALDQTGRAFVAQLTETSIESEKVALLVHIDGKSSIDKTSIASLLLIYSDRIPPIAKTLARLDAPSDVLDKLAAFKLQPWRTDLSNDELLVTFYLNNSLSAIKDRVSVTELELANEYVLYLTDRKKGVQTLTFQPTLEDVVDL